MLQRADKAGMTYWIYDSCGTMGLGVAHFPDICNQGSFVTEHNKGFYIFCVTYCPCCRSICHPRPLHVSGYDHLNNVTLVTAGPAQNDFISSLIVQDINTLNTDFLLRNIYKSSPYLMENILCLRYKAKPVNAVWGNSRCLL
jgi:hypothetical protein